MPENVVCLAAKKAASPADVVGQLVEFGLSASSDTRSFAEEIFSKVPHKASGLNVRTCYVNHFCGFLRVPEDLISFVSIYCDYCCTGLSETRKGSNDAREEAEDLCTFGCR